MPSGSSSSRRGPRATGCVTCRRLPSRPEPRPREMPREKRRSRPSDAGNGGVLDGSRGATGLESRRRLDPEPVPRRAVPRGGARTRAGGVLRRHVRAPGRAPGGGPPRRPLFRAERGVMGLAAYLVLGALVFSIGLFGVLTRRNAVGILLGIELMLNAVNINLVAFARFNVDVAGPVFTLLTISIPVADVAVRLATGLRGVRVPPT